MSVAKHQACFTTKLQGQNLATFIHSAVTPIAYLQHTVGTNKTCVDNTLIICVKIINAVNNAIKKINHLTALVLAVLKSSKDGYSGDYENGKISTA